ncbi:MAG: alpha-galactosidase [Bacteroidales bacterium]|nr:alpha-galactosidase [Bacteroidales bacterium]
MRKILSILAVLCVLCAPGASARKKPQVKQHTVTAIPEVQPQLISIETANTQLLLRTTAKGQLEQLRYGLKLDTAPFANSGKRAAVAFPTAGGFTQDNTALAVTYPDGGLNTELYVTGVSQKSADGVATTEISLKDYVTLLEVKLVYEAYLKEDVIAVHSEILNPGKKPVTLTGFASAAINVPGEEFLLTSFHGDWAFEMQAQRSAIPYGTTSIQSRRGVQTTQRTNPSFLLSVDAREFSETEGDVIAGALEWSGNYRIDFSRSTRGSVDIIAGMNPYNSAYPLAPGKTFRTPRMLYTFSADGAGQASRNLHRWARNHQIYGGGAINPTLLNSWEGAYFSFTTPVLTGMIDDAAAMGLELFVLDDGWFAKDFPRNDDTQGLGDWELNTEKIPEGIDYLASYAHNKGIKFGIWIEPEMVNPLSNLAAAHPDWVVRSPGREILQERNQWILDLSNPDVQEFVYGVFDRTMQLSDKIDYVKWDCNRPVESMGSDYLGAEQGKFYIDYIQGLYSVVARIREKYPNVIVQCCSGGGARVDYGSLKYFNEFWTSDNTDAITRIKIQYGTSMIYPACLHASHVSAVPNHQTGNMTPLKFRFDVACTGRLGMELQPKHMSADERAFAARCIESYKQYRDLVFDGDLYRLADPWNGNLYALVYVSEQKDRAVFFAYNTEFRSRDRNAPVIKLQGLDPSKTYKVTELNTENSYWWGNRGSFKGSYLMTEGMDLEMRRMFDSAVFYIEAK